MTPCKQSIIDSIVKLFKQYIADSKALNRHIYIEDLVRPKPTKNMPVNIRQTDDLYTLTLSDDRCIALVDATLEQLEYVHTALILMNSRARVVQSISINVDEYHMIYDNLAGTAAYTTDGRDYCIADMQGLTLAGSENVLLGLGSDFQKSRLTLAECLAYMQETGRQNYAMVNRLWNDGNNEPARYLMYDDDTKQFKVVKVDMTPHPKQDLSEVFVNVFEAVWYVVDLAGLSRPDGGHCQG